MYFLDINILIKQILPPNWRRNQLNDNSGKVEFLNSISEPFKQLLNDFQIFRKDAKSRINLTAQPVVIENHIRTITGLSYGVFVSDTGQTNYFSVNVPISAQGFENDIKQFLGRVTPIGRKHTLNFY